MENPLKNDDYACLNLWPKGTNGWHNQNQMLHQLNTMCQEHDYGAVAQLALWLEDLWRSPEKRTLYETMRRSHFKMMGWDEKFPEEEV